MLKSLRDDQYEYNRRKSAMMEIDYKRGLELPTIRWTISEGDLIRRKHARMFRDCYLDRNLSPTMVFRRYPNFSFPEYELDILVKALLGFPQPMGYKQGTNNVILNDAWTVNLRSTEKENIMMDSFLKGFGADLKQQWEEGKQVIGVDVSDELKDLFHVYIDAEGHLKKKEEQALESLTSQMKRFISAQEERQKVSAKLNALKMKLAAGQSPAQDEEDEEEDDE